MPTIAWLDGFEHQTISTSGWAIGTNLYSLSANVGQLSFVTGRWGGSALQVAEDGVSTTNVGLAFPASVRCVVGSFYFKASAAGTAGINYMVVLPLAVGANGYVGMTSSGTIRAGMVGGVNTETAGTFTDGLWHRVDFRYDTSTTTFTMDLAVDGTAETQASQAGTAEDMTAWRIGSTVAGHDLTFVIDDFVLSHTSGDYPLGEYEVHGALPNADGTHSLGSGAFAKSTGGTTNVWDVLDEWPTASDYVAQGTADAAAYIEFGFEDNAETGTIDGVRAILASNSAGTAANNATYRIVDSSGTTLVDVISGDVSATAKQFNAAMVPSPGGDGWTDTEFDGLKARFGFSSDATPDPHIQAMMLEYAVAISAGTTFERAVAAAAASSVATVASFFSTLERASAASGAGAATLTAFQRDLLRASAASGTGAATVSAFQRDLIRSAAAAATGSATATAEFFSTLERAIAASGASGVVSAGEFFGLVTAAVAASATGSAQAVYVRDLLRSVASSGASGAAVTGHGILERTSAAGATGAAQVLYVRDLLRAIATSGASGVATTASFFSTFERAAALAAAGDAQAQSFVRELLRASGASGASGVVTAAEFFSIFERASALNATSAIASTFERELLRAVAASASGAYAASGSIVGGVLTYERSASATALSDAQVASTLRILERLAALTGTSGTSTVGLRIVERLAAMAATGTITATGSRLLEAMAALAAVSAITAAGVAEPRTAVEYERAAALTGVTSAQVAALLNAWLQESGSTWTEVLGSAWTPVAGSAWTQDHADLPWEETP